MKGFLAVLQKIMGVLPVAVQTAEVVASMTAPGQKTGAQKASAVQQIVQGAIMGTDIVAGHEIVDPNAFNDAIGSMVNATVAIMNNVKPKAAQP